MRLTVPVCAVGGCDARRKKILPVCDAHWSAVPLEQQKAHALARRLRTRGGLFQAAYRNTALACVRSAAMNLPAGQV